MSGEQHDERLMSEARIEASTRAIMAFIAKHWSKEDALSPEDARSLAIAALSVHGLA